MRLFELLSLIKKPEKEETYGIIKINEKGHLK